jgi:Leucine rich repeat variant
VSAKAKPLTVELPRAVAAEIADAAQKTHRSTTFIVARALAAGRGATHFPLDGELTKLTLTSDEDDPPSAVAAVKKATSDDVAAAWIATRARFAAWIAREEAAQANERADDLDAGLRDAADAAATPARLAELAGSEYVRVRALVARHPATPADVLTRLGADRDRIVRAALAERA